MEKYVFTFGCGHILGGRYIVYEGEDLWEARAKMIEDFDYEWAFQYTEEEWNNIDCFNKETEVTEEELEAYWKYKENIYSEDTKAKYMKDEISWTLKHWLQYKEEGRTDMALLYKAEAEGMIKMYNIETETSSSFEDWSKAYIMLNI